MLHYTEKYFETKQKQNKKEFLRRKKKLLNPG